MRNKLFVTDLETTAQEAKDAHVCEYAMLGIDLSCNPALQHVVSGLVKPPIPIPPEVSAVHHIIDEDVESQPDWASQSAALQKWVALHAREDEAVLVAHNSEYERAFLEPLFPTIPWICTYKCALRIWPEAPSHSNEGLRYYLALGVDRGRNSKQSPHSAGHDAMVTAHLLMAMAMKLARQSALSDQQVIDTLIQWTTEPAQLPTCPIGKHRGWKWADVPGDYLQWMAYKANDMRKDAQECARNELQKRAKR